MGGSQGPKWAREGFSFLLLLRMEKRESFMKSQHLYKVNFGRVSWESDGSPK